MKLPGKFLRALLIVLVIGVAGFVFRGVVRQPVTALIQRVKGRATVEDLRESEPPPGPSLPATWVKVELDLQSIGADGLRGPADGKVAVSYEFAIPNTDACKAEVKAFDATVQFMPGSAGRIRAPKTGCLCIGSTHQPNYAQVLKQLAELPYVERIIECHFE